MVIAGNCEHSGHNVSFVIGGYRLRLAAVEYKTLSQYIGQKRSEKTEINTKQDRIAMLVLITKQICVPAF